MKIVITGTSGFLGREVARAALEDGHQVLGVDLKPDPDPLLSEQFEERILDLLDPACDPESLVRGCQAVIHAAGRVVGDAEAVMKTNVECTRNLSQAMAQAGTIRFVLVSSMAVEEAYPGPYGDSKKAAEALVQAKAQDHVIIRPTMIYGKRDPVWTAKVRDTVTCNRWYLLLGGGKARIQPVYVEDAARAIVAAAVRKEASGKIYRLGGPELIEEGDFLRLARTALGGKTRFLALPLWLLRLAALFLGSRFKAAAAFHGNDHPADIDGARKDLDFHPRSPEKGIPLTFS